MKTPLLLPLVFGMLSSPAFGTTLAINFGPTAAADAEPGYTYAPSDNSPTSPLVQPIAVAFGTFSGVTLSATTGGSPTDNRYRVVNRGSGGLFVGPLGNLSESWIGTQTQGSALTLILDGISAGPHLWNSYHFDNGTGGSGNGNQNGKMSIELSTDSGATFTTLATSFQIQDVEGGVPATINPFSTNFTAVAGQSVHFRFINTGLGTLASGATDVGQDFTVVNGFDIVPIPEPSAHLLCLAGLLGFVNRRRRP